MKPSELISSISPNGYIDTQLMYESIEPNVLEICNAHKAGVPINILDTLSSYKVIDLDTVKNDLSLIKSIEHPAQIVGGFAFSKELADTVSSYFGRDKLLQTGRPVDFEHYYTKDELLSKEFLVPALNRNYYNSIDGVVKFNKDSKRDLNSAKKAYTIATSNNIIDEFEYIPCGSVMFMRDNLVSLDGFSIIVSMYGRHLSENKQILIDWDPEINTEYKKYISKDGPIPKGYVKESGHSIRSLFSVHEGKPLPIEKWEEVKTTQKVPMFVAYNGKEVVATIVSKTNTEILEDINSKIDRMNSMYNCNLKHILISTMGDFFLPSIFSVYC